MKTKKETCEYYFVIENIEIWIYYLYKYNIISEKIYKTLVAKFILDMESRDFHGKCMLSLFCLYTSLTYLECTQNPMYLVT